jgi:hypothetical protein
MPSVINQILRNRGKDRWKQDFENLRDDNHVETSPLDARYNCIAHAAEDTKKWWWPVPRTELIGVGNDVYWPPKVKRKRTVECFIKAFAELGYKPCDNAELEAGFEKVAIYVSKVDTNTTRKGEPTHMARQLPDGTWTSKIGRDVDISHTEPSVLEGQFYGKVKQILKRKIRNNRS